MKIPSLIFIVLVFLILFKYFKILDTPIYIMVIVFITFCASVYVKVHLKNKERNIPRPVYLT